MNMGPQGMGSGGQGMISGPGGPRTMGSGSLGRGAMNNSLMPGGGGMGVRAHDDKWAAIHIYSRTVLRARQP